MRRILYFTMCMVLSLPVMAVPATAGEVIDGVVVSVNHKPIFRSDWDEAVCYELFMQRRPLSEVTEKDRVTALQRLIDRQLLKGQMLSEHALQPSEADLQADVAKLRLQVPEGKDDVGWQKLLTSYGLNEELLKEHLRTELQIMNFVEVRLRPNVHVQPEEVEAYYRNQMVPDLEKEGAKQISFADVEPRIRELLTQQRIDELLDAWLHNLRQQAHIQTSVFVPGLDGSAEQAGAPGSH